MSELRTSTGFTLSDYSRLVTATAKRYRCLGYEVVTRPTKRFALLRHDIDMSPVQALELARIESDAGVRATYTVLLSGEHYSPFEKETNIVLRKIADLGHDIGLHFDASWHGISDEERLNAAIKWESCILNDLLALPPSARVRMFSFHNTTPFTMSCKDRQYAGLVNAYAGFLQEQVQYTSDSNGYWIHRSWDRLLKQSPERIHVLTHPEWWTATDAHPAEKVCRHLSSRSRKTWVGYRTLLQEGNRQNRTGLSSAPSVVAALFPEEGDRLLMLWLEGCRSAAFVDLYCRFERQCRRILRKYFRVTLRTPAAPVQALLSDYRLQLDPLLALAVISNTSISELLGFSITTYRKVKQQRNALVHGYGGVSAVELAVSFDRLIQAVERLADQGSDLVDSTGTRRLSTKGMPRKGDSQSLLRWLKANHQLLDLSLKAIHSFGQRHRLMTAGRAEA